MFVLDHLPEIQPRYPDRIAVGAPLGLRSRIRQAAEAERTTAADWVRKAIERQLAATSQLSGGSAS